MISSIKERLFREESGFTLTEALVAMVLMLTVMLALYSIFDMSLRVFSFGNDKVEAVENARLGMENMEREIRAAYPYDKINGDDYLFPNFSTDPSYKITFGNDVQGATSTDPPDRKIIVPDEEISYYFSSGKLIRSQAGGASSVAEPVPSGGLDFAYLKSDGTAAATEAEVEMIRVKLTIEVDGRTQTLTTDVALRNRSG